VPRQTGSFLPKPTQPAHETGSKNNERRQRGQKNTNSPYEQPVDTPNPGGSRLRRVLFLDGRRPRGVGHLQMLGIAPQPPRRLTPTRTSPPTLQRGEVRATSMKSFFLY